MRRVLVTTIFLLSCQGANAAETGWQAKAFKQDNPNELAYFLSVDSDCPVTKEEVTLMLEGVFVRSRIKPVGGSQWTVRDFYMAAELACLKPDGGHWAHKVDVRFGNYSESIPILYDSSFGSIGSGGESHVRESIRRSIERAITAYLKANFDLGD